MKKFVLSYTLVVTGFFVFFIIIPLSIPVSAAPAHSCFITAVGTPPANFTPPPGCTIGSSSGGGAGAADGWPVDIHAPNVAETQCPFDQRADHGYFHLNAVDIGAPYGTPIYTTVDGTVSPLTGYFDGYGNAVIIGTFTNARIQPFALYGHMPDGGPKVKGGDTVTKGQQVGIVDSTGFSTGNHVHYELQYGGKFPDDAFYKSQDCDNPLINPGH
jgi:murein DD-endopeptidase MepM/ murein hydrolase activator NlpD